MKTYTPKPVDINNVELPEGLSDLVERMTKNAVDIGGKIV